MRYGAVNESHLDLFFFFFLVVRRMGKGSDELKQGRRQHSREEEAEAKMIKKEGPRESQWSLYRAATEVTSGREQESPLGMVDGGLVGDDGWLEGREARQTQRRADGAARLAGPRGDSRAARAARAEKREPLRSMRSTAAADGRHGQAGLVRRGSWALRLEDGGCRRGRRRRYLTEILTRAGGKAKGKNMLRLLANRLARRMPVRCVARARPPIGCPLANPHPLIGAIGAIPP